MTRSNPRNAPLHPARARGAVAGLLLAALTAMVTLFSPGLARAESPGLEALETYEAGRGPKKPVENRFFLKEKRFEIAPFGGYVPNNPFARRYLAGAMLGYHLNETVAFQAQFLYAPDLAETDLKNLVDVLLDRAYNANSATGTATGTQPVAAFQQPLDKVALGGAFGVVWAPLYGKINLVGETVLNFDFYTFAGAGIVSINKYVATYDEDGAQTTGDIVALTAQGNAVTVAPYVGVGQNYFLNRLMALKIDLRAAFYVADAPQYDPTVPVTQQRLYNNVMANGGLAFFFPNMKPRLYNF